MKKIFLICLLGMLHSSVFADVTAYFSYGLFNVPGGTPFLETYITIVGKSAKLKPVTGGFQASVNIKISIFKNGTIVGANNYNLKGPIEKDTLHPSGFIDNQRYPLPNGDYTFEISISDNNDALKKSFGYKENITLNFPARGLSGSSIQLLESYSKTASPGPITKSGYNLIPYCVNYFPDEQNKLSFYYEAYRADSVIGNNQTFVYSYYIERKEDLFKPEGYSGFLKQNAAAVNPLLSQIDISKLESGNYYLVIELRDKNNILQLEKRTFFQRKNTKLVPVFNKDNRSVTEFFGSYSNADTLKMFVECLWPISSSDEKDWAINQAIKKDPELMKKFIVDFWQKRTGDTLDPLQLWLGYYHQVKIANKDFKCGKQKGYYTDRGRVFLQYGKPDQRVVQPSEPYANPYEIWQYYRIYDRATGSFFNNKKFVFVNKQIADDCFSLVHSDMRGEIYNDKWRYEISKGQKSPNVDATNPDPVIGTRYDDLFNNPR